MDCQNFDFGLIGYGDTATEAIDDFHAAYEGLKELRGKDAPVLSSEIFYDVASFYITFQKYYPHQGLKK